MEVQRLQVCESCQRRKIRYRMGVTRKTQSAEIVCIFQTGEVGYSTISEIKFS